MFCYVFMNANSLYDCFNSLVVYLPILILETWPNTMVPGMFFYKLITSPHTKMGKERKTAKTERKFQYLWSCKEIYKRGGNGKEKGRG